MWSVVREKHPIWYFDSTGNVIQKIENQSAPFLFSIVFHDKDKELIFPLAEFISTAHDSHTISGYLYSIKLELERTIPKPGFQIAPIIVTDFSWALLNAVCTVFNNCSIGFYIRWCFEMMFKKKKSLLIFNSMKVRLHLCGAHFLKLVIQKVKRIKKYDENVKDPNLKKHNKLMNIKIQKAFIFSFVLLQNSAKIDDFIENLKNVYQMFNVSHWSEKVKQSGCDIKKKLSQRNLTVLSIKLPPEEPDLQFKNSRKEDRHHEYVKYNSNNDDDETTLKHNSPFTIYFGQILKNLEESNKDTTFNPKTLQSTTAFCFKKEAQKNAESKEKLNEYFSPQMFSIIVDYLHIMPLWTWVIIGIWQKVNIKHNSFDRFTNNMVENWFNQLKNGILQSKQTMPSILCSKLFNKIEATYETHFKKENVKLNKNSKSLAYIKENWKKSKPRHVKGYYYDGIPNRRLFDKFNTLDTESDFNDTVFQSTDNDESWF
jgi:hypothetical protein